MTNVHANKNDGDGETPTFLKISKIAVYAVYGWALFGVIVLSLRVFLLAFSANPATRFVTFIYETSANFMAPFRAIFPGREVGATGYIDVSAMFAIIMYLLFVWGLSSLIHYVNYKITEKKIEHEKEQLKRTLESRKSETSNNQPRKKTEA